MEDSAKARREIFILDDDVDFAHYVSLHLRGGSADFEHFDVRAFEDPYDFMRAVQDAHESARLVLVILDYLLKGYIHGLMVADRLGRDYPDIAQIICTSHTNAKVFRKICTSGACARNFIEKPVKNGKELRQVVEETLAARDEFFSRFSFKADVPPFVIPQLPRVRVQMRRRKEDKGAPPPGEAQGRKT